ncbi:carboxyl-terminal protease [Pedosphaera parvula Ellin514]|uniref:Carboxyl-terminal protease n=1 Tax=Pedosphaera parvula (strain Ellin514) TaxID=320771 RepID=B9XH64_PEDPL|nr:carboxyl-terminal protease [Pedosphaera parvula Ellin514]
MNSSSKVGQLSIELFALGGVKRRFKGGIPYQIIVSIVNNWVYNQSNRLHYYTLISKSLIVRILLILLCLEFAAPLFGAESQIQLKTSDQPAQTNENLKPLIPVKLAPQPNDGWIADLTARMLEQLHFLHQPLDQKISSKFLDRYIDTLDPQHIHFLQSDIADFEKYRTVLGELTRKQHDTSPAYVIFNRFMQRLDERVAYANGLLKNDQFDFTGSDRVLLVRKEQPFPKDMTEAKQFWRDRVRYEYLQEKLNKEGREEIGKLVASRPTPVAAALTWTDFHKDIVDIISHRYSRIQRTFRDWDGDEVLQAYLTALAHVYDPHSDYFDKSQLENFSIGMSLSLYGIGAVLTSEDGYCKIKELNPSGPAFKSKKFKANDRIVAVAQGTNELVDVVDMPLTKVVEMIRGPKGTDVRLTVIPADATDTSTRTTISLTRDEIKLEDQQAKAKIIEVPGDKGQTLHLGVIDLPSFYASFPLVGHERAPVKSTTVDVAKLLAKLKEQKVDGVILDLRRNGGGSLEEAINLTGLFIKEGPVVQVSDPDGKVQVDEDTDPSVAYDGPLIVLTSRFSASASEILAGALQDYGRALIVGDSSTHGKGTVQSLNQLAPFMFGHLPNLSTNDPGALGALKLTTRKFYRASGSSTQLKGVIPDIVLPSINDYLEVGESSLENPLPWDTISTAKFDKVNRVQPYLSELSKRSVNRVASEKDFAYVREDIEQVKKIMAEKSASLNEAQRLKEKEESDVRQKIRDRERKARKLVDQKAFDVTLTNGTPVVTAAKSSATNLAATAKHTANAVTLDTKQGQVNATNSLAQANLPDANKSGSGDHSEISPAALAQGIATGEGDTEDFADPDKAPAVDAHLEEAEHILVDYIALMGKIPALTVNH